VFCEGHGAQSLVLCPGEPSRRAFGWTVAGSSKRALVAAFAAIPERAKEAEEYDRQGVFRSLAFRRPMRLFRGQTLKG